MVRKFSSIALAGALMLVVAPAFAQDLNINPLGLPLIPNSIDLDPLHIFTPAPAPAPVVAPTPAAAPAAAPMTKKSVKHHHHKMVMKKKMMMKK